jgi:hypothetical protein
MDDLSIQPPDPGEDPQGLMVERVVTINIQRPQAER